MEVDFSERNRKNAYVKKWHEKVKNTAKAHLQL